MLPERTRELMVPRFFGEMERDVGDWFNRWLSPRRLGFSEDLIPGVNLFPDTNVAEKDNHLEVTVELPGMNPEDFHVEFHDGELWISGEKREEKEDKKEEEGTLWHRRERSYGSFRRVIPLPVGVDPEKIEAGYKDGLLTVTIPKTSESKSKTIRVTNP